MAEMNYDILKRNIKDLMKEKSMTQGDLSKILNISQSNVSKCLGDGNDSRCFTLEQVYKIAEHFGRTIDGLMGRTIASRNLDAEYICDFLKYLISNNMVMHFDYEVDEEFIPAMFDDLPCKKEKVKYDAFYFPNYINLPDDYDPVVYEEVENDIRAFGNKLETNIKINAFLQKYIDAYEKYVNGVYNKETYDILVEAYRKVITK